MESGNTLGTLIRLGEEEKGTRMANTCLLLSKASDQLSMIKKITFQLHSVLLATQQQTGCKSLKQNIVFIMQKLFLFLCVCLCVCVVSQFDLPITKQNYLFVRCQSLSHIPSTSLRCSNQPLWKLNLMTGGEHNKTIDQGN